MSPSATHLGPEPPGKYHKFHKPPITNRRPARAPSAQATGLTDAQVAALRAHPDVLMVEPNRWSRSLTFSSYKFLGLEDTWKLPPMRTPDNAGSDVLIGVMDSGAHHNSTRWHTMAHGGTRWHTMARSGTQAARLVSRAASWLA